MFDWLFEGRLTVFVFLSALIGLFVGLYVRTRKRVWLYPAGLILLLAGVYLLLDRLVETRSEQITRKLNEMAAAVALRDANAIMRNISDDFRVGGLDKSAFRGYVEAAFNRGVTSLKVWEFQFPDDTGGVVFFAKPEAPALAASAHYRVRARFVQEGSEWRLQTFQIFNPLVNTDTPLEIPALR